MCHTTFLLYMAPISSLAFLCLCISFIVSGSFGIAITLVSDGQEKLSLDLLEKQCNTQIYTLPGMIVVYDSFST